MRRSMVCLQRALERRPTRGAGGDTTHVRRLLSHRVTGVVLHQAVTLLRRLLAVQSEEQEGDTGKNSGTANSHDHANNSVTRLS